MVVHDGMGRRHILLYFLSLLKPKNYYECGFRYTFHSSIRRENTQKTACVMLDVAILRRCCCVRCGCGGGGATHREWHFFGHLSLSLSLSFSRTSLSPLVRTRECVCSTSVRHGRESSTVFLPKIVFSIYIPGRGKSNSEQTKLRNNLKSLLLQMLAFYRIKGVLFDHWSCSLIT
jgi:hypothetical protein